MHVCIYICVCVYILHIYIYSFTSLGIVKFDPLSSSFKLQVDPHWIDPRRAAVVHGDAVLRQCFFTQNMGTKRARIIWL